LDKWALFLDLDGTLVDIADSPESIHIDTSIRSMIDGVRGACGGALALVSGRSLADLDKYFPGQPFAMAGQHGLEWRIDSGQIRIPNNPCPSMADIVCRLEALVARHASLSLENKGQSLALHYRRAPELASHIHQTVQRLLSGSAGELSLLRGKRVVEIRPAGINKGRAIKAFMAEPPFLDRLPVFIGDDRTDEDGFAAVNQMNGVSIKVGPGKTCARFFLRDAAAVRKWIATLL
jgi:trehalose 6-phosphate phosphatase